MKRSLEDTKDGEPNSKRPMSAPRLVGNIPCTLHYPLHREDTSWVETFTLPGSFKIHPFTFEMLWSMHPPKKSSFTRYKMLETEELECPFWSQSFGRTGPSTSSLTTGIPAILIPWFNFANEGTNYGNGFKNPFNAITVHWFENGEDYTYPQSYKHFVEQDAYGNTTTLFIFFGHPRMIQFKTKVQDASCGNVRLMLNHEMGLVMGGLTQATHTYAISKVGTDPTMVGPSILLTFEIFQ